MDKRPYYQYFMDILSGAPSMIVFAPVNYLEQTLDGNRLNVALKTRVMSTHFAEVKNHLLDDYAAMKRPIEDRLNEIEAEKRKLKLELNEKINKLDQEKREYAEQKRNITRMVAFARTIRKQDIQYHAPE